MSSLPEIVCTSYTDYVQSIVPIQSSGAIYIKKTSATRFEISCQDNSNGRYVRYRFDNDETQFVDASPSDAGLGLIRPYQQTLVDGVFLGDQYYGIAASSATAHGTPVVSSSYLYLKNIGDYFEYTVPTATQLRINYLATTNAGTFSVTINGGTDLINLLPVTNGVALIDSYRSSGSGLSAMIADNLPVGQYKVRFTVVGKNASSSDTRMYLDNSTSYGLRVYPAWSNLSVAPQETSRFYYKIGGSGVNYAIAFRPDSMPAASTPFIGGVHGYESATSLKVSYDGTNLDIANAEVGSFAVCYDQVTLQQTSNIYHPDDPGVVYATVQSIWVLSREGCFHSHKWTLTRPIYAANGYPNMFTVYGANSGGPGGALLGWADRVILGAFGEYKVINGDSAQLGHKLTNEAVFYGTPYTSDNPSRNPLSGNLACVINFPNVQSDFKNFINPNAAADGIFVQDRATFRKLYMNVYRSAGTLPAGFEIPGTIYARFVESPLISDAVNLNRDITIQAQVGDVAGFVAIVDAFLKIET